jgi:hypothetical protein
LAEPLEIRHGDSVQEIISDTVVDLIWVHDLRNGGEERSFKIVSVGRPTHSGFVAESSTAISNLNFYVTDAE